MRKGSLHFTSLPFPMNSKSLSGFWSNSLLFLHLKYQFCSSLFWGGFCIIRYLREDKPHGSAGGLYHFRNLIMEDNPVCITFMNTKSVSYSSYLSSCVFLPCSLISSYLTVMFAAASPCLRCSVCTLSFFFNAHWNILLTLDTLTLTEAHRKYGGIGTLLVIKVWDWVYKFSLLFFLIKCWFCVLFS